MGFGISALVFQAKWTGIRYVAVISRRQLSANSEVGSNASDDRFQGSHKIDSTVLHLKSELLIFIITLSHATTSRLKMSASPVKTFPKKIVRGTLNGFFEAPCIVKCKAITAFRALRKPLLF